MKIYVASSWRNSLQQQVVNTLHGDGHEVYDFRQPAPGDDGFSWREIDPNWTRWTPAKFIEGLKHPAAERGFNFDMAALRSCDACVLVLPCGRSAHLELGYAVGSGKKTIVLLTEERDVAGHSMNPNAPCSACGDLDGCHLPAKPSMEPELMYNMCSLIATPLAEVVLALSK